MNESSTAWCCRAACSRTCSCSKAPAACSGATASRSSRTIGCRRTTAASASARRPSPTPALLWGGFAPMCLRIPGRIVEIVDAENSIAKVEVGGVRRNVNVGMLDKEEAMVGNYVLIHVGFAITRIDEHEAKETLRVLEEIGQFQDEFDQFKTTLE